MKAIEMHGEIDPEATYVEFRATGCRECGEVSPTVLVDNPEWHAWMSRHHAATGHTKIHEYKISRSVGEHTTLSGLRRSSRRRLGNRGGAAGE